MPNGNFAIGNTYETTTRPVAWAVAKDCLSRLGFPEYAYLNFKGSSEKAQTKDSAIDDYGNKNWFGTNTEAILQIEEDPIVERIYEASVIRLDNVPVFKDAETHTYIRPIYQPVKMTLRFRLRCQDEVEANRFRDDTWARSHLLRHECLHELTYHWQLPKVYLVILQEIWKLQEAHDQTGLSFGKYLRDRFDPRIDTVTNLAGREATLVVPEDQVRALGWFDFAGVMDKPTFNKDNNTWDLEWSYSLVYDKPVEAAMTYPLVIRQKMIGPDFRPVKGMYKLDDRDPSLSNVQRSLFSFFNVWVPPKGILDRRYPDFDTWEPEGNTYGCMDLWIGMLGLSAENRRDLVSIYNIGDHKLADVVTDFMIDEREYVCKPRQSLFEIGVYSDNERAWPDQVTLGEDGIVRSAFDLSMIPIYHVVISFRNDLRTLDQENIGRIIKNACKVYGILASMYPMAIELGLIPPPSKRCMWTRDQWEQIVEVISPPPRRPNPNPGPGGGTSVSAGQRRLAMQTVGTYNIVTRRNQDADPS